MRVLAVILAIRRFQPQLVLFDPQQKQQQQQHALQGCSLISAPLPAPHTPPEGGGGGVGESGMGDAVGGGWGPTSGRAVESVALLYMSVYSLAPLIFVGAFSERREEVLVDLVCRIEMAS